MRFLFLLAMLLMSPAAFAEWRQFAERNDQDLSMSLYYEPDSLIMGATRYEAHNPNKLKKPKVSIMVIFSRSKPQFSWRAAKFLWEANCAGKKVRLLASVEFAQMGKDFIPAAQEPYMEWMAASDDSIKNSVFELLCTDIKRNPE